MITLDALIPRADFCEADGDESQSRKLPSISLQHLGAGSFLVPSLRKPDFQRETNHWTGDQVITFLKSFLDNELVPSIIFWRSPGKIFVIDGAHRISALLAWINDDYGDGPISARFYAGQIKNEQRRSADRLRQKIRREIGSYAFFSDFMKNPENDGVGPLVVARADNARVRVIDLQWVEGDAAKAESSFFNINKQGTALDKIEERLLHLRRTPIAIATRSIVRAGSGHKYWSQFSEAKQASIEKLSKDTHSLLFSPELKFPIKTLNLPHGGKSSPISAYNILMDMVAYTVNGTIKEDKKKALYQDDKTGDETIRVLKYLQSVICRITGNNIGSLGLHPAVFFYNARGQHWDMIFISMLRVFSKAIRNKDAEFFKSFCQNRERLETLFLQNKALIAQANIVIRSHMRIDKWSDLIEKTARGQLFEDGMSPEKILEALGLSGKLIASDITENTSNFSAATKSAAFLAESVKSAQKCPLCGGLIAVEQSVSYDHVKPRSKGGKGTVENLQMTHPYCNSLKGST